MKKILAKILTRRTWDIFILLCVIVGIGFAVDGNLVMTAVCYAFPAGYALGNTLRNIIEDRYET